QKYPIREIPWQLAVAGLSGKRKSGNALALDPGDASLHPGYECRHCGLVPSGNNRAAGVKNFRGCRLRLDEKIRACGRGRNSAPTCTSADFILVGINRAYAL